MAYQLNPNTGSLFNNEKTKDSQPDYKGSINVEGKVFYLAGWKKAGKDGSTWLSLAISEPKQKETTRPAPNNTGTFSDIDDDIPFASCEIGDDVIFRNLHFGVE